MEKIIFRKFFLDLAGFFLIVSLSLSLITWIVQSVNYLDFISKDGHGFQVYFSFILLNFPKIFSKIMIFSYFVSLVYIINKYQSNNEILIFWTNGISKIRLINFIIKISIIFTVIQMLLAYFVVPKLQDYSRDFIRTSNIDFFSSLITERKFIDTLKDFTIFVESIDEDGNMKNIYLKDGMNKNTQIISARMGRIIEDGSKKYLNLNYGQILDIETDDNDAYSDGKIIKFNNTTFNISKFRSKSTTFPKLQELNSSILIACINNFLFGDKRNYSLPIFHCTESSYIKSGKKCLIDLSNLFIYSSRCCGGNVDFLNEKSHKYSSHRFLILFLGLLCVISSELNSEFLSISFINNIFLVFLPILIFILTYIGIFNLSKKNI